MLLKNLLITTLWLVIPVTVYAATSLCGSASAVVENWKGEYIVPGEELISTLEGPEELTATPEESISTPEYESDLTVDAPDQIVDETEE